MRFSQALLPTTKEDPADATGVSHILLIRAGYIRRLGAGLYSYLPLGLRVLRNIERIVRTEMDQAGAQEVLLPALLPAEYFQETGRWDRFGATLLRLKDRKGGDYHLGPTHEEIVTDLVRREVKSYRDLPLTLYQIQNKYRDEPRPRAGLLRGREFLMKDAYSFDATEDAARQSYERMRAAYVAIFTRLGLDFRMVAADSGAMGGEQSAEFQLLAQSGEDAIAVSDTSDYAANLEVAVAADPTLSTAPAVAAKSLEKVATPGRRTIKDVAEQLKVEQTQCLKSLLYVADGEPPEAAPVLVVLRGDHEVNEMKLARLLGVAAVRLTSEAEVQRVTGAPVGSVGPIGFSGRILIDRDASVVSNAIVGANEKGVHYLHMNWGRDASGEIVDVRNVVDGDPSPDGHGTLRVYRGIEAGHIFLLGTFYSQTMGATFLADDGTSRPVIMGCYGIGISRLVAATVEQHHDTNGICWPLAIAPYHVHLVTIGQDPDVLTTAEALVAQLAQRGVDVLWDDRDERPGVKFKDADLIGIPYRLTLGEKGKKINVIEWKHRDAADPKSFEALPLDNAAEEVAKRIQQQLRT